MANVPLLVDYIWHRMQNDNNSVTQRDLTCHYCVVYQVKTNGLYEATVDPLRLRYRSKNME